MLNIPHSRPVFGQAFTQAAAEVMASGFTVQGRQTEQLEQILAETLEQRYVLAVDSGTSALMLAIRHYTQDNPKARIGIPSYACASLLFAVKAAGATPVFMDCDKHLCLERKQAFEIAENLDALILVHPFGMVDPIITKPLPCPVIEDIAQSAGATVQNKQAGIFADISIGSLYATKPWGGAYGGFISSARPEIIAAIKPCCDPDQADITLPYAGHHQLSNLHAAIAIQRIRQASTELKQRKMLAEKYDALLKNYAVDVIKSQPDSSSNHGRYLIRCREEADKVIARFQAMGIAAMRPVQSPLHLADPAAHCPIAQDAWKHCISLPMLSDMSETEFNHMQQGIEQCLPS